LKWKDFKLKIFFRHQSTSTTTRTATPWPSLSRTFGSRWESNPAPRQLIKKTNSLTSPSVIGYHKIRLETFVQRICIHIGESLINFKQSLTKSYNDTLVYERNFSLPKLDTQTKNSTVWCKF